MLGFSPSRRHLNELIGVDISPERASLLQFTHFGGQIHIAAYASEALPEGAWHDLEIRQPEAIAQAILRARQRCATRQRHTVLAVAGAGIMHKIIHIPAGLPAADQRAQIWLEAGEHIPYPLAEVSLDFQILPTTTRQAGQSSVLLVACRREHITQLTHILDQAGLAPAIMDTRDHILHNACRWVCPTDVGAILDIGFQTSRFIRGHSDLPQPAQHWPVGSQALEEQTLNGPEPGALDQLQQELAAGRLDPACFQPELGRLARQLGSHLQRTIQAQPLAGAEPISGPVKLGICGRVTRYPGLAAALEQHLPCPVVLLNPLAGLPASPQARDQHLDAEAPGLLMASGLALRGLA